MNIVMLSGKDFAGSGNKIATAVNRKGKHSVTLALAFENSYHYPYDICLNSRDAYDQLKSALAKADLIHFKGDDPPPADGYWYGVKLPDVPQVVSVGGSNFRRMGVKSLVANGRWDFKEYRRAGYRSALTPDLNYPEYEGHYTQQCIDSKNAPYTWHLPAVPVIAHSPSHRLKKGTDIVIRAFRMLQNEGINCKLDLIEKVSNAECVERKKDATIFVDQISDTGFYGISALEAMQFGIPTIAYISDQAQEQSEGKLKDCPVISPDKNVFSLYVKLKNLLSDPELIQDYSWITKDWADKFHSFETVGKMWTSLYTKIADGKLN